MTADIARQHEPLLNLAEIEPFVLGTAAVDPGHRRISWDRGHSEEVEPRVMKVLVALAQADGHVVSRDRLIHLCWDDRIVGDDAINRCVQSIRRLAKTIDPPAFHIETTARVGYTLISEPAPSHQEPPAPRFASIGGEAADATPGASTGPKAAARPMRLLSIGAVTLALASAAAILPTGADHGMTRIAITADHPEDARLAGDLKIDLNQYAGSTLTDLSLVDSPRQSDFAVRISTSREGGLTRANAALSDGRTKDLLWSATADSTDGSGRSLRGQLSAKLGNLFACTSKLGNGGGARLDTAAKRLFLSACTKMDDVVEQHDIDTLRKLTTTAPKFAAGWSYLALAQAQLQSRSDTADRQSEKLSMRRSAAADLKRAQALNPDLGTSFAAAAILDTSADWARRLKVLEDGIARDPDEYALFAQESMALASVGLAGESLAAASRAAELKPFSVAARMALIWALVHDGQIARARKELASAETLWPDAEDVASVRFSIELRYGDARAAKRMIDSGRQPYSTACGEDLMFQARLSPTRENVEALIRYATVGTRSSPAMAPQRLLALAQFGATEEAYSVLAQPGAVAALQPDSEILFRPQFAALRRDPRFLGVAARLGLLQFWRDSGRWPDFCSDPGLSYDCKARAARLLDSGRVAQSRNATTEPKTA